MKAIKQMFTPLRTGSIRILIKSFSGKIFAFEGRLSPTRDPKMLEDILFNLHRKRPLKKEAGNA